MASSSGNLSGEERSIDEKHKKKKKKHKHKKHSKAKKSKKSRQRSLSLSDSASSDSEEWAEKLPASKELEPSGKVTREDWMLDSNFGIKTYINESKRLRKEKEQERRQLQSFDRPGQHDNELNPYWKDGGSGLPSNLESGLEGSADTGALIGDGGLGWLRRSYQRAVEQAKEENKSLEEIAIEKWGSLQNFYTMIEKAEVRNRKLDSKSAEFKSRYKRPKRHSDSDESESHGSKSKYEYDYIHKRDHKSSRRTERYSSKKNEYERRGWRKVDIVEDVSKPPRSNNPTTSTTASPLPREVISNSNPSESSSVGRDKQFEGTKTEEGFGILSDKEMNELSAKIMKAEILGQKERVEELKGKLDLARKQKQDFDERAGTDSKQVKKVTKVIVGPNPSGKDKKPSTHDEQGKRVRYFPDDEKYTIKNMFEKEKLNYAEDENLLFSKLAAKGMKTSRDYDLDEIFVDKASSSKSIRKEEEKQLKRILADEKSFSKTLDSCKWCFDSSKVEKNLIISIGKTTYLSVPSFQSMCEGHCILTTMNHVTCSTELDEDVWDELLKFKRALVQMFKESQQDVVFFETSVFLKKKPHMFIECIPMPTEVGELAPIYFKKAIQECETEWSQNKKIVDLKGRDVRRAVPKGLPYFTVDFGLDPGFAHVIEDERNFPHNFAQEIVGGMLELDHSLWRKHKKEDFHKQRNKVMDFVKMWSPFDWTR